jgi:hypothetical protein
LRRKVDSQRDARIVKPACVFDSTRRPGVRLCVFATHHRHPASCCDPQKISRLEETSAVR